MVTNKNIDWSGDCNFENGKVVSFKTNKASNHYHMKPIPSTDKAIEEAKRASVTLEALMRPATCNEIVIAIKKLSLICGKQNRTAKEIDSIISDYYNDLSGYPIRLINEACEAYRKLPDNNNFMPTSGKLIALMETKWHKMKFLKARIDKILGTHEDPLIKKNRSVSLDDALARLM